MSDLKRRLHRTNGRRWLVRLFGVLLGTIGTLFTSLMPTSVSAKQAEGNGSVLEQRIQAVRDAADAAGMKPGEQDSLQLTQWRNWPNWPNWGNYWNNWPNW